MLETTRASTPTTDWLPESAPPSEATNTNAITLIAVLCGVGVVVALVTVSPMVMPSTPAMARMSPVRPMVSSTRLSPEKE